MNSPGQTGRPEAYLVKSAGLESWLLRLGVLALIGSGNLRSEEGTGRRKASFAQSGGVYAGGSDGTFGTLNAFRARVDGDHNARLRAAREKGLVNVVQLEDGRRWRGDRQEALAKLRSWLERTDLSLVDVLHFWEENPYNAATWLDPLYAEVKAADPDLPVYVWPSYPLGPLGQADGYLYDAYGSGYSPFRRRVMQFLRTGKPLIVCVDGSGHSDLIASREQVMVCRELDIPVYYFVADSGSGSYNNWYGRSTAILAPWRNFVFSAMEFQRRSRADEPLTAGDLVWGDPIELSGDREGKVDLAWTGLGRATVYGFQRLKIDGDGLAMGDNRAVALDYQFWSLLPVRDGRLLLDIGPQPAPQAAVMVERSRCGKSDTWQEVPGADGEGLLSYGLGELGQEFRLRIALAGHEKAAARAVLRGCRLTGTVASPPDRAIDLDTFFHGWRGGVRFRQELPAGLWRIMGKIDNAEALEPGLGLAMRGKPGYGVGATVVERFRSDRPLKNIAIRLTGYSHSSLGGSFSVGVSLDGKELLKEGVRGGQPRADGHYRGTHTLDLTDPPEFQGVRELHVFLSQRNSSGVRGNVSSTLERLEIDASYAE